MLVTDEAGRRWLQQLAAELAWLKAVHPDKTALIAAAGQPLAAAQAAGSVASCSTVADFAARQRSGGGDFAGFYG